MIDVLRLLGAPEFERDGATHAPKLGKPFALLAYLAVHGDWVGRDRLALLFWPDNDESSAKQNLRQLLRRARALPCADGLEVENDRARWAVDNDVAAFRGAVARGEWGRALALWRGALLAGMPAIGGGIDTWLELERDALARAHHDAVLARAAELEADDRPADAAELLRTLLERDDLAEDVLQRYLRAAYLAGRRDDALATYRTFAERLAAELELEPLEKTRELVALIREATAPDALAGPAADDAAPSAPPLRVLRPPHTVGRERTRAAARAADAPLVVLVGEAGIGKSRLLGELTGDAPVLRCREGFERVPYHPLVRWLRERLARGEPVPELGGYLDELARLVPEFAPGRVPSPADGEGARGRLLEAVARYLEAVAPSGNGVALAIDDLQWADDATVTLLLFLAERGSRRLLAARRSYETPPPLERALRAAAQRGEVAEVALEPLDEGELQTLLATLMERDEGPPIFAGWLHRTTGGNPMFALETIRTLFASGGLELDAGGGAWRTAVDEITRDYSELEVPAAVAETIERRLAGLRPETLRVLQSASVVGEADPDALARMAGLSPLAVLDELEIGVRSGILAGRDFAHDLLRQGLGATLSAERRRRLHARAAEALTGTRDDAVVAEHHWRAGESAAALAAWTRAGRELRLRGLPTDAARQLERALELVAGSGLDDAPEGSERDALWALRLELARARKEAGDPAASEREVAAILERSGDDALRAAALTLSAGNLMLLGRIDEADAANERAARLAGDDPDLQRELATNRATVAHYRGDVAGATTALRELVADARREGPSPALCQLITNLAAALDRGGDHEAALPLHREAHALAERLGDRRLQVDAALNLLYCTLDLGRPEEGIPAAEAALALGRFEGSDGLRTNVAAALLELGRADEAARHYRALTETSEDPTLLAIAWTRLAEHGATHPEAELPPVGEAVERALAAAAHTDFATGRARAAIGALRFGDDAQAARGVSLAETLQRAALPDYLRAELDAELGELAGD